MGLFGNSMMRNSLQRETPEERRQREAIEARLGMGGAMPGMGIGIDAPGTLEAPKQPRQSFWQGGDKFTGRDGIAGILAAIGDVLAQRGGMQAGAMQNLTGGRLSALKMAQDRQAQEAEYQQGFDALVAAGYPPAQANAMARGVLKPSDVKPDRMMTKSGDILSFGADGPPTTAYRETAPDLLPVQGAGVFAMDRHTGQPYGGSGPTVGTVEDGHRFKGGNPGDPNSWEPVSMGGAGLRGAPRTFRR